jgi:Sigma-70 region 2
VAIDHKQESALLRHTRILFIEGTPSGLTDAELLERFVEQRGERSELAFTVLLERHARMVLAACRRVLGDPHDVQDAFQATFLVLVRNARSIRSRNKVVAHNTFTQKDQLIFLNANSENPLEVSFIEMNGVVGLNLKGTKITRTAVYNLRTGVWIPLDFREPVSGEVRNSNTGNGTLAYNVGRHFYTFNIQTGKLDHFDLDKITDTDH